MNPFQKLLSDNRHGASYIYRQFIRYLIRTNLPRKRVLSYSQKMVKAHPSMAEFINLQQKLQTAKANQLRWSLLNELKRMDQDQERLVNLAVKRLKKYRSLFTYSASSLVEKSLKKLPKKTRIFVTESRPMMEGRGLARRLSRGGYRVTLGTDAMMGEFVKEVDAIVLGCDALTPRDYIHKVGTRALVILAREEKIPVFVLVTPVKVLSDRAAKKLKLIEQNAAEVWGIKRKRVEIRNRYFERIPRKGIKVILFK